nr:DUF3135 domain-containing protein [Azoarcus sp. TTM-91]
MRKEKRRLRAPFFLTGPVLLALVPAPPLAYDESRAGRSAAGPQGGDIVEFDFDQWSELAKNDPAAFFQARRRTIDRFISEHPVPQAKRLREMQRFIDCVRMSSGSPMRAVRGITCLMKDRVETLSRKSLELDFATARLREVMAQLDECR